MAALFPRWSNSAYGIALGGILVLIAALIAAPMIYMRTPYASAEFEAIEQPVQFDHRHHVRDDGIQCLYCHPNAERGPHAGIPPTELCMGCHGQIWINGEQLAPVRESWETGNSIPWVRVYDLPDFVYFNHSVHVRSGIDCSACHGRVEDMARVYRVHNLSMDWCITCHRNPPGPVKYGRRITPLSTCSACHR